MDADLERLEREFRRQLDAGMWAGVPLSGARNGRREALLVSNLAEVPPDAEAVIFFPRAQGGDGSSEQRCSRRGRTL